jgi:hypothetical protein
MDMMPFSPVLAVMARERLRKRVMIAESMALMKLMSGGLLDRAEGVGASDQATWRGDLLDGQRPRKVEGPAERAKLVGKVLERSRERATRQNGRQGRAERAYDLGDVDALPERPQPGVPCS